MERKLTIFVIRLFIVFILSDVGHTQNIDCNGNTFYCDTPTSFLVCFEIGSVFKTVDNIGQPCSPGTYCRNTDPFECASLTTTTLISTTQFPSQNCNGNQFLCTSPTTFLLCVDFGQGYVTYDNNPQVCNTGTYCSNTDQFECSSTTTATTAKVTTIHPTTTIKTTTLPPTTTAKVTTIHPTTTIKATTLPPTTTAKVTTIHPTTTIQATTLLPTTTAKITTIHPTTTIKITTLPPTTTSKVTTIHPTTTIKATTLPPTRTSKVTTIHPTTTIKATNLPSTTTAQVTTKHPTTTMKATTFPPTTTAQVTTKHPTTTIKLTTLPLTTTNKVSTKHPTTTVKATTYTPKTTTLHVSTTRKVTTKRSTSKPTTIRPFICTTIGRFPDVSVANCKGYILCTKTPLGVYIPYKYSCPSTSYFNPFTSSCSITYKCPSITTKRPTTKRPTTKRPTTKLLTTKHPTTRKTVTLAPFICTSIGRFPDISVANCKGYILCTKTPLGIYIPYKYSCPLTSSFNPSTSSCSITYKCPSITTKLPTTNRPTTKRPTTKHPTTKYATTSRSSSKCISVGRLPDPSIPNCQGYILCVLNPLGGFIQASFLCSLHTTFNPVSQTCSTSYQCPSISTTKHLTTHRPTTKKPVTTAPFICPTIGRFPDTSVANCKGYILCTKTSLGIYISYKYSCPLTSYFNPSTSSCSITYKCPSITTKRPTTKLLTTKHPTTRKTVTLAPFICTSIGRFPDISVANCKGYILCTKTPLGIYIAYKYSCPSTSSFNPSTSSCSITYKCPSITTKRPTTKRPTTRLPTTKRPTTKRPTTKRPTTKRPTTKRPTTKRPTTKRPTTKFVLKCTSIGRFPDPSVPNCKGYILCSKTPSGGYNSYTYSCPSIATFNPITSSCSTSYVCPSKTTKRLTTKRPTTISPICLTSGRIPDPTVANCKGYILCLKIGTGYIQAHYLCPATSVFNSQTLTCSSVAQCI